MSLSLFVSWEILDINSKGGRRFGTYFLRGLFLRWIRKVTTTITRATFDERMVQLRAVAIIPVRGEGSRVWDTEGKEVYRFCRRALRYCIRFIPNPTLVNVCASKLRKNLALSMSWQTSQHYDLLKMLTEKNLAADRVFFANMSRATKRLSSLARRYGIWSLCARKHENQLPLIKSFHGRTLFTVSVGES